jgi:hypothetical protein
MTSNPRAVEEAIAVPEAGVWAAYDMASLKFDIKLGSWCGRPQRFSFRDVLIGRKRTQNMVRTAHVL